MYQHALKKVFNKEKLSHKTQLDLDSINSMIYNKLKGFVHFITGNLKSGVFFVFVVLSFVVLIVGFKYFRYNRNLK